MAISDLTGTTWVFDDAKMASTNASAGYAGYLHFTTANGTNFYTLSESWVDHGMGAIYFGTDPTDYMENTLAWYDGTWANNDYKTITITGGSNVTNATTIAFLEAVAVQQLNPVPNKVIFGNTTIMDISDTTAEEGDVASGMVFYKADGTRAIGTMSASKSAFYGTSSTTASTTAKVVSCADWTLTAGNIIGILFSTANTASAPTLNINSTGAIGIRIGNSAPVSTTNVLKWSANTIVYFMYDGTYYRYINAVSAGSVEQPRGANTWYGTCGTTASTTAKVSTINNYVLTKGSVIYLTCTTANTADAPTLNINSTGAKAIYYNNAVTASSNKLTWDAGETLTFVYTGSYYYFVGRSADAINANGVSF